MKKITRILGLALLTSIPAWGQQQPTTPSLAQQNGTVWANGYANWSVPMGSPAPFSWGREFCTTTSGGATFASFTVGTPITIVDEAPPIHNEVVTVTGVNTTAENCSITTSTPQFQHTNFQLTTATGGLQEAINANLNVGQNTAIELTQQYFALGGLISQVTGSITGNALLNIVDTTKTPFNWYRWNGTHYVLVSVGSGGGGGNLGTLQGDLVGNNQQNTAAVDQNIFVAGAPTTGQNLLGAQDAVNAANTNNGAVIVAPAATNTPFTNTPGIKVWDTAPSTTVRSVLEFGAVCNTRNAFLILTQGSQSISISGDTFSAADVGKIIEAVGLVGGVPTRFISHITAQAGATATIQTAAPFTQGGATDPIGNDDTAAIQQAFTTAAAHGTNAGPTTAVSFPQSTCLAHAINYTGQSIYTVDALHSTWNGMAGEDVLYAGDSAASTAVPGYGVHWDMPTMVVDDRIDATLPWQDITEGTTTQHAALDRPGGILTSSSSNPTAPGWFRGSQANGAGAFDGASSVTDGSAVICTPNAWTSPPVGNKIVFPYLASVFTTTVSSTAGICAAGSTARTLAAALPTGSTSAQQEWFTGTSPQTISANISGTSCPATITVANPVIPSPVSESNVAPKGVFKIDAEQFAYTFRTNAGVPGTQQFTGVTCAQNGTTRAAHSTGATIFPLNPYQPSIPWPVTPTLSSGVSTPANARFYPAWKVGTAAFAFINSNGNAGNVGLQAFANAWIEHWRVIPYDGISHFHSAAIYTQGAFYNTHLRDFDFSGEFGIIQSLPTINTGGAYNASQPTGDGSTWYSGRINACHVADWVNGGQNTVSDVNMYSDCYSDTNSAYVGAGTCQMFTQGWNDETGAPMSSMHNLTTNNLYCEPEAGSAYGTFPVFEYDAQTATHINMHMGGGGEFPIGGSNQNFVGGNFNNQNNFPVLNYGANNGSDGTQLLAYGTGPGNVYGTNALISWGPNAHFSGATSQQNPGTAPNGTNTFGNDREPWHGQSMDTFEFGNTAHVVNNFEGGFIPAAEFNTSFNFEANPFNVAWHYDSGTLPDGTPVGGSVGCTISTDGVTGCNTNAWDQAGIAVGPGDRLAGGPYTMYIAVKSTGAATSFQLKLGICAAGDSGTFTIPVTSSWAVQKIAVDFSTAIGNCSAGTANLAAQFTLASPSADTISVAYLSFAPVAQSFTAQTINVTNLNGPGGANGCGVSPVTGISNGYVCPTAGWNYALASNQTNVATTISLTSTSGLPAAGCFEIDSEAECYTAISGTTLTGITRAAYATTAAAHTAGSFPGAISMNLIFGAANKLPLFGMFGFTGSQPLLGVNQTQAPQNHAGTSILAINSGGNETWFDLQGGAHQVNGSAANTLAGSVNIGSHPNSPNITDTANVMQQNIPASFYTPQTFGAGVAGSLNVITTPTITAPTLDGSSLPAGTNTTSYVCSGYDFDNNQINGSTVTVTNSPATWAFPTGYRVFCPYVSGVNIYEVWRTAGGGSTGYLAQGAGPGFIFSDYGGTAAATDPNGHTLPVANGSNPQISVAGTGTPCVTMGATGATVTICSGAGAPTSTCGTQPNGSGSLWMRTDGAASTSLYSCAATTWTPVTIP